MINVMVISDTRLYREGLAALLDRHGGVAVGGTACSVGQALDEFDKTAADAVVIDMTITDALIQVRGLVTARPLWSVVALGVAEDCEEIVRCAEAGVASYVQRDASVTELVTALETAARQELVCSPQVAGALVRHVARLSVHSRSDGAGVLTSRELEVAQLIDEGWTNQEIASALHIGLATAKTHVHNILRKLGVRTRGQAASLLRRDGRLPRRREQSPHRPPSAALTRSHMP